MRVYGVGGFLGLGESTLAGQLRPRLILAAREGAERMRLMHGLPLRRMRRPLCLAAGVFDGVHLGHREIISSAVRLSQERGCVPAVLTFAPHPDTVLFHRPVPPQLTTLDEKLVLLGTLGVQLTIVARFDRSLAITPAESFVRDLLADRLHACCLTVGEGWRFGARGQGNAELLERLSPGTWLPLPQLPARDAWMGR